MAGRRQSPTTFHLVGISLGVSRLSFITLLSLLAQSSVLNTLREIILGYLFYLIVLWPETPVAHGPARRP